MAGWDGSSPGPTPHAKQGGGFGYSGVCGLNALLATLAISLAAATTAPVIVSQRLPKARPGHPAARSVWSATVKTTRRLLGTSQLVLVRMDSAFYGRGADHAALAGGAAVSVTVRVDRAVKKAIAAIDQDGPSETAWTALFDRVSDPPPVRTS